MRMHPRCDQFHGNGLSAFAALWMVFHPPGQFLAELIELPTCPRQNFARLGLGTRRFGDGVDGLF